MANRTPFWHKKQPGGNIVFVDQRMTTGDIWFVDSGNSNASDSSTGAGVSPDRPFATINGAFASTKLTANNGDEIHVMPGHAETGSDAGEVDFDVAGIKIVGHGHGAAQPTITLDTATDADIDIDAAGIEIENINFVANFADIAICLDVNADDFKVSKCRFTAAAVDMNFKVCVQPAGANVSDRITIEGCRADLLDAVDTHFINLSAAQDGIMIRDNVLYGAWATMCIGGAGVVTRCSIIGNFVYNIVADADHCINMAATATGILANNRCIGGHATDGIVPGDLGAVENYYEQATSDDGGNLEPAA